jgi:hypothetical protein
LAAIASQSTASTPYRATMRPSGPARPTRRAAAQPAGHPGQAAGPQVRDLQPVHQQVVAVQRQERIQVEQTRSDTRRRRA